MPNRGLEVEQALALFTDLPSDDGSDASSTSSNDESVPIILEEDVDVFLEEDMDIVKSEPGLSTSEDVTWDKKGIFIKKPAFSSNVGPSDEILALENPTPIQIFLLFFTMDLMKKIVFQTNLYATQKQKNFVSLEVPEFLKFLAINILMGIKRMPSYRDYWSSESALNDSFISKQMPVNRFGWILGNLHLNDNTLLPKRGEPNYDKLYKLRPLISELSHKFLSLFHPHEKQAIGESMVKFKGRSSLKQCMSKKPVERGYKIWMRCDESGFACQFQIHMGKTKDITENLLGQRVVKDLCESIFYKNHKLYMDNYFTSYSLFRFLETKEIYCCGTVNMNRKHLPKYLIDDKEMNRGELDFRVSSDNIYCIKWMDRQSVVVLSNQDNPTETLQVKRKEKDGTQNFIPCPKAVAEYTQNIGYVDHFDHLKSLYEIDRKCKKWWHRIFFHLIDMTVTNSYIMHKLCHNNSDRKSLKDFRVEIVTELINLGQGLELPKLCAKLPVPHKKHKPIIPESKRLMHASHIPVRCTKRRCTLCSTGEKQKRTNWMCPDCQVPLCMQAGTESCFKKFHSS